MEELKEFKQDAGGKGVALLVEDNEINAEIALARKEAEA